MGTRSGEESHSVALGIFLFLYLQSYSCEVGCEIELSSPLTRQCLWSIGLDCGCGVSHALDVVIGATEGEIHSACLERRPRLSTFLGLSTVAPSHLPTFELGPKMVPSKRRRSL